MSERMDRYHKWQELARTSPDNQELLLSTRPAHPMKTERDEYNLCTRVWWNDGAVEDIFDQPIRLSIREALELLSKETPRS